MSCVGYPLHTSNYFNKRLKNDTKARGNENKNDEKKIIWVILPSLQFFKSNII